MKPDVLKYFDPFLQIKEICKKRKVSRKFMKINKEFKMKMKELKIHDNKKTIKK